MKTPAHPRIDGLIQAIARLPGLGPRSARRIVLDLLAHRESRMRPLADELRRVAEEVRECGRCGNLDLADPCTICRDERRAGHPLCVVEQVSDLWALERGGLHRGRYHVLGGVLNALEGVGPDDLRVARLVSRVAGEGVEEVILALSATVDGQTTAHYLAERLHGKGVQVTAIAHGVPVGGSLDYLDEGTLATALRDRRLL